MEKRKDKLGDTLEVALWFNAEKEREYESAVEGIYRAFTLTEFQYGLRLGPVAMEVCEPMDERVPDPDPNFGGTPKLLVGTALVVKLVGITLEGGIGFTQDLDEEALQTLRTVTQNAFLLNKPPGHPALSNAELDKIIDEVGPETAIKTLQSEKDERTII